MGFKENLDREKYSLMKNKRPYETAAFIIFALLFIQQMFYLIKSLYKFIVDGGNFLTQNITSVGNLQAFFNRTIFVDSSKWLYVIAAIGMLALYYFLVYLFVWNYCKKRNLAKWTWTTLVVFGPGMIFMPAYMIYILYIFRNYVFRFIKTIIEEYKAFDPKELAAQEAALLAEEDKAAEERAVEKKQHDAEKAEQARIKEEEKKVKEEAEEKEKETEEDKA